MTQRRTRSLIALLLFYCFLLATLGFHAATAVFISCCLWSLVLKGHLDLYHVMSIQLGNLGKWLSTSSQEFARRWR